VSVELRVEGVEKTFAGGGERRVLGGVSFAAPAGSIVCVLGPSGCGKTTLLRIIAGLEAPDRGRVVVGERAVAGPLREIGYITQEATLLPWRTVRHNVELGLEIAGVPPEERRTVARRHLELVELAGFDDYFPKQISGGMKQKVALARSLAVGVGWMTLVAAEFTGVRSGYGLGYLIMTARDIQRADLIVAGMLVIGLIGFGMDALIRLLERRLLRWR
jgi:ABC-type nitrate/sulfonate/bicarbonate transport system ATPase subunit